jgi:hypothetical protein
VIPARRPDPACGYDMNVAAMSLEHNAT